MQTRGSGKNHVLYRTNPTGSKACYVDILVPKDMSGGRERNVCQSVHACMLPAYLPNYYTVFSPLRDLALRNAQPPALSLPTYVPRTVAKASSTPQHASTVVLLECLSKITELAYTITKATSPERILHRQELLRRSRDVSYSNNK